MKTAKHISSSVSMNHQDSLFFGNPERELKHKHGSLHNLKQMQIFKDNKTFGHSLPCQTLRPYFNRL